MTTTFCYCSKQKTKLMKVAAAICANEEALILRKRECVAKRREVNVLLETNDLDCHFNFLHRRTW